MAASSTPAVVVSETTFRSYTPEQGANYAQNRRDYHPDLYKLIIDHHISTGGQLATILDVGCGPGTVARALAPQFTHAIGLDPSEGMISTARGLGGLSSSSEPIRFEISSAEDLGSQLSCPIPVSSIDLITAATAAHWFDMSRFWHRAAEILKPGGTIALWTGNSFHVHPSMPNHVDLQATLDKFFEQHIKPYAQPGSMLGRDLYTNLLLPWTMGSPVPEFDQSTFYRKEWNRNGDSSDSGFFKGQQAIDLNTLEKALGTASPVTRWREAHPGMAGTEGDVVRIMRREIERILHEAGVEKGKEMVRGGVAGVLLMFKKST